MQRLWTQPLPQVPSVEGNNTFTVSSSLSSWLAGQTVQVLQAKAEYFQTLECTLHQNLWTDTNKGYVPKTFIGVVIMGLCQFSNKQIKDQI